MTDRISVTVAQAVRLTGISKSEFYRLLADGKIPARKSGRTTLVMMADLRAYLDSLPVATFNAGIRDE